jgi:hypothetical protein
MSATPKLRCPVHDMPDCSPLLNGCRLVLWLHEYDRALVDNAIESVAGTCTSEGVAGWWHHWATHPRDRYDLLRKALSYGGQVAT